MTTPANSAGTLLLWRDRVPRPGWANMALDRAFLDLAAGEGVSLLRLYRWAPSCLSFGRHEPAARRYDRARIEARGLDTVRRPTGGRAVWHARELTYAVATPETALGGLRDAYRRIHTWLAEALVSFGADATLAAPPARAPTPADGACFAAPVGGEVLVRGWKVVGSAQVRTGGALLQHGSLLLEDDQAMVRAVALHADPRPPAERSLRDLLAGREVTWEQAAEAVEVAARAGWPAGAAAISTAEIAAAEAAAGRWEGRFRDPTWTWGR